jgi:hypothetical protein
LIVCINIQYTPFIPLACLAFPFGLCYFSFGLYYHSFWFGYYSDNFVSLILLCLYYYSYCFVLLFLLLCIIIPIALYYYSYCFVLLFLFIRIDQNYLFGSFEITSIRLYTSLRYPLRELHSVYNLIEVISSWTEQKLRSILNDSANEWE